MLFHALDAEFPIARVILEDAEPRYRFLARRTRRYGLSKAFGQALFVALAVPLLEREARARIAEITSTHGLRDDAIPDERVLSVRSANSPECIEALRALAPATVIVNGTRILSRELLECVNARFLNIHCGITPRYRGVHGGYWALVEDDRAHCGVTVHEVDVGIDTGRVVAQARIEPTATDNFASYPLLQIAAALPLFRAALRSEIPIAVPSAGKPSKLWPHPTLTEYVRARYQRGIR